MNKTLILDVNKYDARRMRRRNAANACALAELWFADKMAGEFGHVSIDERWPLCSCGKRGCWERYASNSAAIQYYMEGAGGLDGSRADSRPRFEEIIRLADGGDSRAIEALERMARFLGIGVAGLATGLAPELIVLVGDVTGAWDRVGPIVIDEVKRRSLPHTTTHIVPTDRATRPRLRGAVTLVVQQHFGALTIA